VVDLVVPNVNVPLVLPNGMINQVWFRFLEGLFNSVGGSTGGGTVVSGTIILWPGTGVPTGGYLQCDGSAVSRTTYATLFALFGTTFGPGNGSTTFNLPDLRGRVPMGTSSSYTLGTNGGDEEVNLTVGQLPPHNHTLTDPGHGHAVTDPGHTHGVTDPGHSHLAPEANVLVTLGAAPGGVSGGVTGNSTTGVTVNNATTGVTVANSPTGVSIADTGSGDPVSLLQPYLALKFYVKT
jgi:microcystin-dependent protein